MQFEAQEEERRNWERQRPQGYQQQTAVSLLL